ncbi:hypothetical protein HY947_01810 [Candidatus Gottesmanbacteria bacterium]|nr:hypothetical protein [Candidatus Gottesmanbacteria bacterium]
MARVFLDTNIYVDAVYRKPEVRFQFLHHEVYYSSLSTHILFYVLHLKVPDPMVTSVLKEFGPIDFTASILEKALNGPTTDMEDNIQLHSAAEAECDYFLTNDKKLLSMTYFGKTRIVNALEKS